MRNYCGTSFTCETCPVYEVPLDNRSAARGLLVATMQWQRSADVALATDGDLVALLDEEAQLSAQYLNVTIDDKKILVRAVRHSLQGACTSANQRQEVKVVT